MNATAIKQKSLKVASGFAKTAIFPIAIYLLFLIISVASGKNSYYQGSAFDYIFTSSVLTTIMAYAIAIPLSGGRWDFAAGTIAILSGIIGCNLGIMWGESLVLALLMTIVISVALALLEGLLYIFLRVSNTIVSLGVVMIYEALTSVVFNGDGVKLPQHEGMIVLNQSPWVYILMLVVFVLVWFLLQKTKFGLDTKSLGSNAKLAIDNGVNEPKNILLTYVLVGVLLGIAGVLNASKANITPVSNLSSTTLMYNSMGPVLIGLFLGEFSNSTLGILMASIGMNSLSYGMVVMNVDGSIQQIITGIFIVLFMAYSSNRRVFARILPWKNLFRLKKESV